MGDKNDLCFGQLFLKDEKGDYQRIAEGEIKTVSLIDDNSIHPSLFEHTLHPFDWRGEVTATFTPKTSKRMNKRIKDLLKFGWINGIRTGAPLRKRLLLKTNREVNKKRRDIRYGN